MLYSVDRFEGDVAVLIDEDKNTINVIRTQLPAEVKAGDMVRLSDDGYISMPDVTEERRQRILRLQQRLRQG